MSKFSELSVSPGSRVNPETGEVIEKLEEARGSGTNSGIYKPSSYSQKAIDDVRSTTGQMCEKMLCNITQGRRVRKGNNKGYDIVLPNKGKLESKVGRVNKPAVVKESQLSEGADYYGFMYYAVKNGLPPSYFTSLKNGISPIANLKRNIIFTTAVILPKEVVIYHYNTAQTVRGIISSTGVAHRGLSHNRSKSLFQENPCNYEQEVDKIEIGKHHIDIFTLGLSIK